MSDGAVVDKSKQNWQQKVFKQTAKYEKIICWLSTFATFLHFAFWFSRDFHKYQRGNLSANNYYENTKFS